MPYRELHKRADRKRQARENALERRKAQLAKYEQGDFTRARHGVGKALTSEEKQSKVSRAKKDIATLERILGLDGAVGVDVSSTASLEELL